MSAVTDGMRARSYPDTVAKCSERCPHCTIDDIHATAQDCVHAYMRKRRKTEAKEKAEELENTRLRVATDNLAVLAQARPLTHVAQRGCATDDKRRSFHVSLHALHLRAL